MNLKATWDRLRGSRGTAMLPRLDNTDEAATRQQRRRLAVTELQRRQRELEARLADLCAEVALEHDPQ